MGEGPSYAARFECIGPACEDHCCRGWPIPLDRGTFELYRRFPEAALRERVAGFVAVTPASRSDRHFAEIRQVTPGPTGVCPFLETDRLCGIQKRHGPLALSATCSIYPRNLNRVEGRLEGSLSLSCPEAARQVLLDEGSTEVVGDLLGGRFRTDNAFWLDVEEAAAAEPLSPTATTSWGSRRSAFEEIRRALELIIRTRVFSIADRVLLMGWICRRLAAPGGDAQVAEMLAEVQRLIGFAQLPAELQALPRNAGRRLGVILELTNFRMADRSCGRRFEDTFWTFIEGIGSPLGEPAGDDLARFTDAEESYCRPFFERAPFMLENFLLNYVYQHLFPFGRAGGAHRAKDGAFGEYLLMATQFAWMYGLLTGVAGHYREAFAEEHVVTTVQSFCRAIEHFPEVLDGISEQIALRGLDSLEGMAILLRG